MKEPLLLYSTATRLAHQIAQLYYRDVHYAWCSPVFDGRVTTWLGKTVPPSSSPCEIYWGLHEEATRGDKHSDRIDRNRDGIIRGAHAKQEAGIISDRIHADIIRTAERAERYDFRPLLLVMPYGKVKSLITNVSVVERANELSAECLIRSLPGKLFEGIGLVSSI